MDDVNTLSLDDILQIDNELGQLDQQHQAKIDELVRDREKNRLDRESRRTQWWDQAQQKHAKDEQDLIEIRRTRKNNAEEREKMQARIKDIQRTLHDLEEDGQAIEQKHQKLVRRIADRERDFTRFTSTGKTPREPASDPEHPLPAPSHSSPPSYRTRSQAAPSISATNSQTNGHAPSLPKTGQPSPPEPSRKQPQRKKRRHNEAPKMRSDISKKPRRTNDDRTVQYEELRANATNNPKKKQKIIRRPKDGDRFIVLMCKEHNVLFGLDGKCPIRGAAKHLRASAHVNNKTGVTAEVEFSYTVLGCDQEKMDRHNRGGRSEQARSEKSPSRGSPWDMVEMRAVGELCEVWYEPETIYYAAVVLPVGDFSPVGMIGTLSINTELTNNIPGCYKTLDNQIVGWADGYEDGGPLATEREYPVLYLEDRIEVPLEGALENPKVEAYGWVPVGDLETLSMTKPDARAMSGFKTVKKYLQRMENLRRTGLEQSGSSNSSTTCVLVEYDFDGHLRNPVPFFRPGTAEP